MGAPSQLLVSSRQLCLSQSQHPAAALLLRLSSPAQEGFLGLGLAPLGGESRESRAGCLPSSAQELPSCSVAWHCRSQGKSVSSTSRAWEALGAVGHVNTWESWNLPWSHGFASWCTPVVAGRLLHQTPAGELKTLVLSLSKTLLPSTCKRSLACPSTGTTEHF